MSSNDRPVVLKADPAYRRRALLVYATCVPLGLVLVLFLRQWALPALIDHLRQSGNDALGLLKVVGIASMVIPLGASVLLFRLGRRIQVSQQVPLPGTKVIRDTAVVSGPAARRLGTTIVALSIASGLLVAVVAVRFARL
jgi:hypothetical protein